MAIIKVTQNAKTDLKEIHSFIKKKSFQNAENVVLAIRKEIKILEQHPETGHIVKEINSSNFREIKVFKFRIIYYLEADIAYILTVHHSAMLLSNNPHFKDLL